MDLIQRVRDLFDESIQVKRDAADMLAPLVVRAADIVATALLNERMILSCGNGGSAAIAQHFATIMLNRLELERPGLPAIALTTNVSTLTSIAEDYQYADIFSRQIRVLGRPGDVLLAICTYGNSHTIIQAIDAAHDRNMHIIVLTGHNDSSVETLIENHDMEIRVPSWNVVRIQENHQLIIHVLCDLVERRLLGQED